MNEKTEVMRIRIDASDHDWLKSYAEKTERTMAAVMRLALRDYIERQQLDANIARAHAAWNQKQDDGFVNIRPGLLDVAEPHETD